MKTTDSTNNKIFNNCFNEIQLFSVKFHHKYSHIAFK